MKTLMIANFHYVSSTCSACSCTVWYGLIIFYCIKT